MSVYVYVWNYFNWNRRWCIVLCGARSDSLVSPVKLSQLAASFFLSQLINLLAVSALVITDLCSAPAACVAAEKAMPTTLSAASALPLLELINGQMEPVGDDNNFICPDQLSQLGSNQGPFRSLASY